MSWSRFSDSDVYTFPSTRDGASGYECCACPLMPPGVTGWPGMFWTVSAEVFVQHLAHHRDVGHDLPADIEAEVLEWALSLIGGAP